MGWWNRVMSSRVRLTRSSSRTRPLSTASSAVIETHSLLTLCCGIELVGFPSDGPALVDRFDRDSDAPVEAPPEIADSAAKEGRRLLALGWPRLRGGNRGRGRLVHRRGGRNLERCSQHQR